ncbi:pentatricopeptide repeat-containing protein At3g62470, mitochondrial-like [Alnus glutinosa]|uniref:pentatricopeptide repeat-containing protein At3g62470, mitochondrial-like n=1 Tax=Alnus glutinosa TaxID=3517 RepID=UPI002D776E16|nr:pentatricopeptide repeat-containing protein At3g62470, mitochondrial-like [Alnus glutinosa]
MALSLRKPIKASTLVSQYRHSQPHSTVIPNLNGHFTATQLRALDQGRGQEPHRGEQVRLPNGSSMPLSRMLHSHSHCSLYHSHCQVPLLLPHPTSLSDLQEKLLIHSSRNVNPGIASLPTVNLRGKMLDLRHRGLPSTNCRVINVRLPVLPIVNLPGKVLDFGYRGFARVTGGGIDSDAENNSGDDGNGDGDCTEGVGGESGVDPNEVNRVCKVIDELFALDRNMETVLDECGIDLSHDLVVDVLQRFKHARKPAFRFFCWAGQKPGFVHDSRTYNVMMNVLGKTRQFETMVSMLEEMGEKGLLTIETFMIAIKSFAAAKERKKAVGTFELMKKYKFKVGVDTINCLLDTLGRAKLGKEAQTLFEKLKGRFTHNLQTYTVLLNGWCRVKNLMEAGRVWNEMIEKGFKPDIVAHNIMLEGLLRCKKRSDAIKLFEVMKAKGPSANARSYTILIRDLCKQTKMEEAVEYFDEMIESGCQPDAVVYTCLITGFGNQKNMDMVFGLLKEMKEKSCPPDGHTYNALIKLMTCRRMPDNAVRIYKKMIESDIEPSIHTYNMIMKSYFQTRNYEMGHAVWDEMIQKGCCPDDNSYTVFIRGLISQGRSGDACKYLEEMIEKGMKAPQLDYNRFAADFSRAGKPDILEELARKMKFAGKFEESNVFARWADMMKKRVKRRDPIKASELYT